MMKTLLLILTTLFAAVSFSNGTEIQPRPEIIPYPAEVEMKAGTFDVSMAQVVFSDNLDDLSKSYVQSFADHMSAVAGNGGRNKIIFSQS